MSLADSPPPAWYEPPPQTHCPGCETSKPVQHCGDAGQPESPKCVVPGEDCECWCAGCFPPDACADCDPADHRWCGRHAKD